MTVARITKKCDKCKRSYEYNPSIGKNIMGCPYCYNQKGFKDKVVTGLKLKGK